MASISDAKSPFKPEHIDALRQQRPTWQQTMLRVKDGAASLAYYSQHFGMELAHFYHFGDFSLFFMASFHDGSDRPAGPPGSDAAHDWLWDMTNGSHVLELTWNHPPEGGLELGEKDFAGRPQLYHSGNAEPFVGFGHICFNCPDVYAASAQLEKDGVAFKKRPDEGRMKGLAFALDPDGYWVELVKRDESTAANAAWKGHDFNLSQTMIRVKDLAKSVPFYRDLLGMKVLSERHFDDFSLFFLATDDGDAELKFEPGRAKKMWNPCLELTHNHGTEKEEGPSYHNGNDAEYRGKPAPRGFGHIGFIVDDLEKTCEILEDAGVEFQKKPKDGSMHSLAFAKDPDGYWIELIDRKMGGTRFPPKDAPAGFEMPAGLMPATQ